MVSFCRYCLWILGNEATLTKRNTIWKELVIDAKKRRCFYNAHEDKGLAQAFTIALVGCNQMHILLNMDSFLFRKARWMVCWFFYSNSCNDTLTCKDVSSSVSNINWLTLILLFDIGLLQQRFFEIYVKNWRCWDLYKSAYFVGKSCKWLASTSKQEKSLCPSWSFFPIIRAVQGQRVAASSLDCRHSQGKFELHSDFEGLGHFAIIWNAKTSKSTWCPIWELYFGKDKSLQTQKPQWVWILS